MNGVTGKHPALGINEGDGNNVENTQQLIFEDYYKNQVHLDTNNLKNSQLSVANLNSSRQRQDNYKEIVALSPLKKHSIHK